MAEKAPVSPCGRSDVFIVPPDAAGLGSVPCWNWVRHYATTDALNCSSSMKTVPQLIQLKLRWIPRTGNMRHFSEYFSSFSRIHTRSRPLLQTSFKVHFKVVFTTSVFPNVVAKSLLHRVPDYQRCDC